MEGSVLGPSGSPALSIKLAVGVIFFASSPFAICRRLMVEVSVGGLGHACQPPEALAEKGVWGTPKTHRFSGVAGDGKDGENEKNSRPAADPGLGFHRPVSNKIDSPQFFTSPTSPTYC